MEAYMDKKAEIQSRLVKAKAKQEGLPFRAALREEVLQIKGFENYSEKINGGIADLYIELEDLNASINKLIVSSQANKDDVVSAVGQDQYSEKLVDVNNSVIKLQTELLEKGLRVKSVEKLEAITKDVVKSIKAIDLPTSMDIKSLPKGLASDKTLDQVNKNLLGITKQLKALEPKPLGRLPEDYVPFRRVISDGNRLYFDDFVAGGGAGGGAGSVGLTDAELRATPVPISGTVTTSVGNISNDLFGSAMTGTYFNQIEIDFSSTAAHLLTELTTTATSGGSASIANGQATLTTGANTNGGFKAVSNISTEYRPMSETYAAFSTIFTAGLANSYQRIGLYNTNNGFFIGYEGTSFGVTKRTSGADTTIAQASFSEDTLTGASTSTFTRNGTPEALDTTKDNLYRIRFGWLGAAPIYFEVFSPDGEWVVFHKIKHPNSSTLPSIAEPNLPITMDIKKTTGGATVLNMSTACWAAGTTAPPSAQETKYGISDIEATATYKYFGFQSGNQYWYIMRKTIATKKFEYAAGASAYATAWTNRATQTYTDYATAF